MPTIFEKLNLKDHREILVLDAPASFEPVLATLEGVRVRRSEGDAKAIAFALAFVTQQARVDRLSALFAGQTTGDVVLWFAYPKGTSKRHACEFNRDTGWTALRAAGFDSVRQVAIDEDWTALRFRRLQFIGPSTRRPATGAQ